MEWKRLLSNKKESILKTWLNFILETYPIDTQRFLKTQKDQFANPVRSIFQKDLANIFDWLISEGEEEDLRPFLDGIVRVRAIHDFEPSKALAFIFKLKDIIRDTIDAPINGGIENLEHIYQKVDRIALCAFDVYMNCREKIYKLMADESVNRVSGLLRKKGLLSEIPVWGESERNNIN